MLLPLLLPAHSRLLAILQTRLIISLLYLVQVQLLLPLGYYPACSYNTGVAAMFGIKLSMNDIRLLCFS